MPTERTIGRILRESPQAVFRAPADISTPLTCAEVENEFAHIELTEQEKALGLIHAYELATRRLEMAAKQKEKQMLDDAARAPWTYNQQKINALDIANQIATERKFKKGFVIDSSNEKAFHLLCLYFTNNPEFESYVCDGMDYSLNKGIWLQSAGRGTGKSVLLELFMRNKRSCFFYQHVPEIRMFMLQDSRAAIEELKNRSQLQPIPTQRITFFQTHKGFMYDELFGEEKVNVMGNVFDISEFIIQRLYDQRKEENWFWKFHITSNYDGEAIEKKCGKTVRSRMAEMFNLIKLEGPDRRKV